MVGIVDFSRVFDLFSIEEKVQMYNVFADASDYPHIYRNSKENRERLDKSARNLTCKWLAKGINGSKKLNSYTDYFILDYVNQFVLNIYKCKSAWIEQFKAPTNELLYYSTSYRSLLLFVRLPFDIKVKIFNGMASSIHERMFIPKAEEDVVALFYNDVRPEEYLKKRSYYFSRFSTWKCRLYMFKTHDKKSYMSHLYTQGEIEEIIWKHIDSVLFKFIGWEDWLLYKPYIAHIDDLPDPEYTSINQYYLYDDVDKWWYKDEFENENKTGWCKSVRDGNFDLEAEARGCDFDHVIKEMAKARACFEKDFKDAYGQG